MSTLFTLPILASFFLLIIGLFAPKYSLFWNKKNPTRKKSAIIYSLALVVFFVLFGITSDDLPPVKNDSNTESVSNTKESTPVNKDETDEEIANMPIEQRIAILDGIVDPSDLRVTRIKVLLNDLAERYQEPVDTIANYTSKTQDFLHDKGITESCLNILEDMHKVHNIPKGTTYADALTLYATIRNN